MILILTYHKVLRRGEGKPDFYTITPAELERHLDLLAQTSYRSLQPSELPTYRDAQKPCDLLTFDDGTLDHFEIVLPLLDRYKTRAIFFVPTAKLNRNGYLTTEQLQAISHAGHTVGLHSHEHRRLDVLNEEDIRVQMELSQQILQDTTGSKPVMFAPPGGFINKRVRDVALEYGIQAIRTMRWGYNKTPDLAALDCVPLNRFMNETQFHRALQFQSRAFTYALKEMTKRLIPGATYEALRGLLFKKSAADLDG